MAQLTAPGRGGGVELMAPSTLASLSLPSPSATSACKSLGSNLALRIDGAVQPCLPQPARPLGNHCMQNAVNDA